MKVYCFSLALLITTAFGFQSAKAQDFCSLIKKEVSPDKTSFDFLSPYDPNEDYICRVTRSYSTNAEEPYDNFYIILQTLGELDQVYINAPNGDKVEKEEKGLVVEFEDKSKYTDDTVKLVHDLSIDKTKATRYVYYPLSAGNIKDFAGKKIVKYTLAGSEHMVQPDSANAVMHYVQCLKAVH
jgi:hypothetical protein